MCQQKINLGAASWVIVGKEPTGQQLDWWEEFGQRGWKTLTCGEDAVEEFGGRCKMTWLPVFPEFLCNGIANFS